MSYLKPKAKVTLDENRRVIIEVTTYQENEAMKVRTGSTVPQMIDFRKELDAVIAEAQEAQERINSEDRERYSLELGVNHNGERVCALEAGPFETSADAVGFAFEMRGKFAFQVKALSEHNTEYFDVGPDDPEATLPIVGATLNVFTHRGGTTNNIDLY